MKLPRRESQVDRTRSYPTSLFIDGHVNIDGVTALFYEGMATNGGFGMSLASVGAGHVRAED